jgi:hypothetical protein
MTINVMLPLIILYFFIIYWFITSLLLFLTYKEFIIFLNFILNNFYTGLALIPTLFLHPTQKRCQIRLFCEPGGTRTTRLPFNTYICFMEK